MTVVLSLIEDLRATRQALDAAEGPHCNGCGNAVDDDVCWCGDYIKSHGQGDGHTPVRMGCDCSRDPRDVDWPKVASGLRARLWAATKGGDKLKAEVGRLRSLVHEACDVAEEWIPDSGMGEIDRQRLTTIRRQANGFRVEGEKR